LEVGGFGGLGFAEGGQDAFFFVIASLVGVVGGLGFDGDFAGAGEVFEEVFDAILSL